MLDQILKYKHENMKELEENTNMCVLLVMIEIIFRNMTKPKTIK